VNFECRFSTKTPRSGQPAILAAFGATASDMFEIDKVPLTLHFQSTLVQHFNWQNISTAKFTFR